MDASQQGCAGVEAASPAAKCRSGPGGREQLRSAGDREWPDRDTTAGRQPSSAHTMTQTAQAPGCSDPETHQSAQRSKRRPQRPGADAAVPKTHKEHRLAAQAEGFRPAAVTAPRHPGPRRARRSHARPRHTGGLLLRDPGRRICAMAVE